MTSSLPLALCELLPAAVQLGTLALMPPFLAHPIAISVSALAHLYDGSLGGMSLPTVQKICEEVVNAAKAAQQEDFKADFKDDFKEYEGQKWHHWPGYPVNTIICDVDGECVAIKLRK